MSQKNLAEVTDFPPIFGQFWSKLAEMKILLFKWHMAIKTYFINLFLFIIEKFDFPVKVPPEKEVL